jgi:transcriptional regulator with PAS, ATPase and Fis domain
MLKVADGGCVFFDEVGELPLSLQGKLLRFLQTQAFYPLGSTREVQVNVRVLSATNRPLLLMVRERKFREDLYHRLKVTSIHVPPLRERREDLLPLIHFFVNRYRHTANRQIKGITKAFLKKMVSYDWPGNIRELKMPYAPLSP